MSNRELPYVFITHEYEIHKFSYARPLPVFQGMDGYVYATLNSLCHIFGLDQEKELDRIQKHVILQTKLVKSTIRGETHRYCLRLGFIGTWLLNLPIDAVEQEKDREELIQFQINAAHVLEEAFCEGRLTEWPFISELLEEVDDPMVQAYKEAVAVMGLARDQLIDDAKTRRDLFK